MSSFAVSAPAKPTTQKQSKPVSSMLCKTSEEVAAERCPRNAATIDICEEDESDQQDKQPLQAESPRANEE
jgi:hypothetical protein